MKKTIILLAFLSTVALAGLEAATPRPVRVLVWDEQQPEQKRAYGEKFLGETIAAHLAAQPGFTVKNVSITSPSQGLDEATLQNTDVVIWWSHQKNAAVADENVERLVTQVRQGRLGFIALHSAHWARPFVRLMQERAKDDALAQIPAAERATARFEFSNQNPLGKVPPRDAPLTPALRQEGGVWKLTLPGCIFPAYRGDGAPSHVTTLLPNHPIAAGLPLKWDVKQTEMYDEPFHVPKPDAVVFEERWDKGEHFRSGCVWQVGKGRVFYFRPGHETFPVYQQAEPLRVLENAARWLAPEQFDQPLAFNTPEADAILSALEIFPPDNPWNIPVNRWPVAANSAAMIAAIGATKPLRYNADMGFVLVPPGQKRVGVKLTAYAGESDPGPYPVPDNAVIEGWPADFKRGDAVRSALTLEDVQRGKPTLDADRHGIVVDPVNRRLYEFYRLTRTDTGWTAEQASIFDLASNKLRPQGWTSSDAAGLPVFPAIVRHDELKRGRIEHALRVTFKNTRRAFVYPATHFASRKTDANLPRMGERFRLRQDFDTSKFSPEARTILEALKRYGMFNADNGIDWAVSVAPDERIPVLHDELRKVKGSDFEVVTPPEGYMPSK